ncbi:MAG: hypothetical protein CMM59_13210 [Rhodospirillaceae bacterium]|nr:hypothetical protein [Rhodospirillaceae bacterium]
MKIFIVDDDSDMIAVMTALLEGEGHHVQSSVAGMTAISEISAFKPDLLLTDLVMAQVDGLALCRELRKRSDLDRMKIIFVSSKVEAYWREQANDVGAIGYIEKPLDTESFSDTVASLVSG